MATARLDFEYQWNNPDLSQLLQTVRDLVLPFIGKEFSVNGSMTEVGEDPVEYQFQSFEDFEAYTKTPFQRLRLNLYAVANNRTIWDGRQFRVNFEQDHKRLSGSIEVEPEGIDQSRALKDDFRLALGAENFPGFGDKKEQLANVQRAYYLQKMESPQKTIEISKWLVSLVSPKPVDIRGEIRLSDAKIPVSEVEKWESTLVEQWEQIEYADLWARTRALVIFIQLNGGQRTLDIGIDGPSPADLLAQFRELEERFDLTRFNIEEEEKLVGYKKMYFVKQGVDAAWISKLRPLLLSEFRMKHYFQGSYTLLSAPNEEVHMESFEDWEAFLKENLYTLATGFVWFYRRFLRIDLYFDPFRDRVFLKIEAFDQQEVDRLFEKFVRNLGLEVVEGEPYRHRKSSGSYRVLAWDNNNFADAIETALKVYVGEKYVLVNAYVEMGPEKNGQVIPFATVTDFLSYVRSSKFANAELHVDGPFGRVLFIHAYDNHDKLDIRSTLDTNDFPELEKVFKRKLSLKKVSYEDETKPGEKKERDQLAKELLKIVIPLIVGFLLSSAFWANVFPKYAVSIEVPRSIDGQVPVIKASEIRVEWITTKQQWFRETIDRESFATVRVLKDGTELVEVLDLQAPGVSVGLSPGIYDIQVLDRSSGVSDIVRIEVQEP